MAPRGLFRPAAEVRSELRQSIERILDAKRQRIAALQAKADVLLVEAIEMLDRAGSLRERRDEDHSAWIEELEALATRMEETELEFREKARREAQLIPGVLQEGHLLSRQIDLIERLMVASRGRRDDVEEWDLSDDPDLAPLVRAHELVGIELRRLRELREQA